MKDIYIDRLCLYFDTKEELEYYIEKHFNIFTKEELKDIILCLVKERG